MTTQVNIKLDAQLKKQAEKVAHALGFTLSGITKAFLASLVRTRRIDFSLEDDTPADMTGKKLEQAMIKAGYSKAEAKKNGDAYDAMLKAEKEGRLIKM